METLFRDTTITVPPTLNYTQPSADSSLLGGILPSLAIVLFVLAIILLIAWWFGAFSSGDAWLRGSQQTVPQSWCYVGTDNGKRICMQVPTPNACGSITSYSSESACKNGYVATANLPHPIGSTPINMGGKGTLFPTKSDGLAEAVTDKSNFYRNRVAIGNGPGGNGNVDFINPPPGINDESYTNGNHDSSGSQPTGGSVMTTWHNEQTEGFVGVGPATSFTGPTTDSAFNLYHTKALATPPVTNMDNERNLLTAEQQSYNTYNAAASRNSTPAFNANTSARLRQAKY